VASREKERSVPRLSMALCPACERANPPDARFCGACGSPLVTRCPSCDKINVRTRAKCHHCGHALEMPAKAVTADAGTASGDEPVVPLLVDHLGGEAPEPGWTLSLRADTLSAAAHRPSERSQPSSMVADPDAPRTPAGAWPPIQPPDDLQRDPPARPGSSTAGAAPERDLSAGGSPIQVPAPPPSRPGRSGQPLGDVERAEAKARRRAKVRAAQLARRGTARINLPDVLVMEPDPASRAALCAVLEGFGFRVHLAVSVAEAQALSLRRSYAAVFLGMARDAVAAAALCQQLHDGRRHGPLALVGIGDPSGHADRVRMQLAGADTMLMRPVQRGDVARALDAADVALPHDPRLH